LQRQAELAHENNGAAFGVVEQDRCGRRALVDLALHAMGLAAESV
jgi:hypothetical protein